MSTGIVIITAEDADVKIVNRLLLSIRDWEFGAGDRFKILQTKNEISSLHTAKTSESDPDIETKPPLQDFEENEWAGMTLPEVERTMLSLDREKAGKTSLFLVLDSQGIEEKSIILCERASNDPEEDEFSYLDEFNKMRVPWEKVHAMWCNLDIANMGFEEFMEEHFRKVYDSPGDRWFTHKDFMKAGHYDEPKERAEKAIRELEKLDLA